MLNTEDNPHREYWGHHLAASNTPPALNFLFYQIVVIAGIIGSLAAIFAPVNMSAYIPLFTCASVGMIGYIIYVASTNNAKIPDPEYMPQSVKATSIYSVLQLEKVALCTLITGIIMTMFFGIMVSMENVNPVIESFGYVLGSGFMCSMIAMGILLIGRAYVAYPHYKILNEKHNALLKTVV